MKTHEEIVAFVEHTKVNCDLPGALDDDITLGGQLNKRALIYPQLLDIIDQLLAEQAKLLAERKWQPIETAPKDGTHVLLFIKLDGFFPGTDTTASWYWNEEKGVWNNNIGHWLSTDRPTHWMPLPQPPTTEEASA